MSCPKCEDHQSGRVQVFMYEYTDERRRYRWLLQDAHAAIARLDLPPSQLIVSCLADWFNKNHVEIDQQHLAHVDMEKPAIVLLRNNGAIVLDGNHRLYRAFTSGPAKFPVYLLEDEMVPAFSIEEMA
jgi:hypothetical protein